MVGNREQIKTDQRLGKRVAGVLYVHADVLSHLSDDLNSVIARAREYLSGYAGVDFNVVKISEDRSQVSFLHYPEFFTDGFPSLLRSWSVDFKRDRSSFREYANSLNPPVLHRKEVLLGKDHESFAAFSSLTRAAEELGLFAETRFIGFKRQWESLVHSKGYRVQGNEFVPIANAEEDEDGGQSSHTGGIQRHLTALTRYGFSAPVQALARLGFLDGTKTVFDYGCGKGDDVRGLLDSEIDVTGWDPHFRPDGEKREADIVNLGFVINVIENPIERTETLRLAFSYARELLVVSAMIGSINSRGFSSFSDGVITARNTFQKYYRQDELKNYIESTLDRSAIAVGPGVFFVFQSEEAAQAFTLQSLSSRRRRLSHSGANRPRVYERKSVVDRIFETQWHIVSKLWDRWIELGREPQKWEMPVEANEISSRSLGTIFRELPQRMENGEAVIAEAAEARHEDLLVFFAKSQFVGNKRFRSLHPSLKQDVKIFFGHYDLAIDGGRQLLFSLSDVNVLIKAARAAEELGLGIVEDSAFFVHASVVEQLPSVLRAYIMCGTHLYGDLSGIDLIKVHFGSSKLSLMQYESFIESPLPKLVRRTKLNLQTTDIDVFDYSGEFSPQYLYRKSRFINEEFPHYEEQVEFEEKLTSLGLLEFEGFGPSVEEFDQALAIRRYRIDGFELARSMEIPDLDSACGSNFVFRDLIECGETQSKMHIANIPKAPETFNALHDLAVNLLDPIIEYFGPIKLTYGFCSPALAKAIPKGIAPKLDQHAAFEKNTRGGLICERGGASCDFLVEDEDMLEVVQWIHENLKYDRVYFYGKSRPIHVSFSQDLAREIYVLEQSSSGKTIPKKLSFN